MRRRQEINTDPPLVTGRPHIELNRQFREVTAAIDPERAALESYAAEVTGQSSDLDWDDLLKRRRVVVLGEPGSGKTQELRNKTEELRVHGKYAFFIRLDQLVFESLESSLGRQRTNLLLRWMRSRDEAVFFLDSVDESKRQYQNDFLTALDRFQDGIREGLARATIVMSSRISEWRPETDAWEVKSRFPIPPTDHPGDDHATNLLIVQLVPLDKERVRLFAQAKGVDDPDAFLQQLDAAHAWPFARRPLDVLALITYWQRHGGFGSLRELIEFDLQIKLRETHDRARTDPLSEKQAREGAMALGAAVAFCRRFEFSVPDDRPIGGEDAMDAAECLPEGWPSNQKLAILNRAVFDGASVGRIRFHHRRVAEYLAAEWLNERMAQGCELERLDQLLFERTSDKRTLRPSLAPVTAWLACGDEEWNRLARQWILEADPALFLRHGDPTSLPVKYRESLFRKLVERYRGRQRVWIEDAPESLARIAHPDLAPVITKLAIDREVSNDLREVLLQVVRHGRLSDCVDVALEVIADPLESDGLKQYAAAAVRDAGGRKHKQRLASIIKQWPQIGSNLCGIVCEAVYPEAVDAGGLMGLLHKAEDVADSSVGLPWILTNHLDAALPADDQVAMLEGLINLVRLPPHVFFGDKETPISACFSWAGDMALSVVPAMLARDHLDAETTATIADALALLLPQGHVLNLRHLREGTTLEGLVRHPQVRRKFVWARIAEIRADEPGTTPNLLEVFGIGDTIGPEASDLEWLCDDIENRETLEDRRLAHSLAIDVWNQVGRPWRWRRRIQRKAQRHPGLVDDKRARVDTWVTFHLRRLWYRHIGTTVGSSFWWNKRGRKIREFLDHVRQQRRLLLHLGVLASGQETHWLADLASEAASKEDRGTWTTYSWDGLRKRRGRRIAQEARTGCKRAWRRYQPLLPHEKPLPTQTDQRIIVGLSGIAAAFKDGDLDPSSMSADDARLVTRYAVNELNGFPAWFFEVSGAQSSLVGEVLTECLIGEWRIPAKAENVHEVLSAVRWYGNPHLHFIADTLMGMLRDCDPQHPAVLEDALAILLQLPEPPRSALAQLAADRAPRHREKDRHWSMWILIWMQTDAVAALDYLEGVLNQSAKPEALMERICGALSGQHTLAPLLLNDPDHLSPACLRRLIPLAFRHIRPEQDVDRRSGEVYTPTARDDAQFFRSRLLSQLAASDHPDADRMLQELLAAPELEHLRDWILHLTEERRTRVADRPPWQPEEIREFTKKHETDPRNHHDLFEIGRKRLSDIRCSVEADEFSARRDLRKDSDEPALQLWLARQLRERSKGRYKVTRESEIDPGKKPDLQIHRPGIAGVPIEVKWADEPHWTGPKLFERLENQLIGDYLRPHDARCGFFVLGHKGTKKHWQHPEDHHQLTFSELVDALQAHADAIISTRADVNAVAVVGIDFSQNGCHENHC